jgi:hypothetical protein
MFVATWKEHRCKVIIRQTFNFYIHVFARITGEIYYPFGDMHASLAKISGEI